MADSATSLSPPPSWPYPVVVSQIKSKRGSSIKRGGILLEYSFFVPDPDEPETLQKRLGSWECPIGGEIAKWQIKVGDRIDNSLNTLVLIREPCTHAVQLEGLCALCGADLTESDYLGFSQTSRASIRMSHENASVTVSLAEASRLDNISVTNLLSTRRLSLIVDLDQTIIHATVDPTVGEWMAECGLLEAHLPADDLSGKGKGRAKKSNPNAEALKDVGYFQLTEGKGADNTWYYVKPRPGLPEFLSSLSKLYEMHVYTMGTRAYAEKVCSIIDPKGAIFGRRILSRDENGSMTAKSLARLFPVDTSMVVIIDDRSDVWNESRNLVKVIPYDFFVGIGDINSAFLPKLAPTTAPKTSPPPPPPSSPSASSSISSPSPANDALLLPTTDVSSVAELEQAQQHVLEEQVGERSLAKQQEKLEELDADSDDGKSPAGGARALLNNDDSELDRLDWVLRRVHKDWFAKHDSRKSSSPQELAPSAPDLIDQIKSEVFAGCKIVFSGVIAMNQSPERSEFWRLAKLYGATCENRLSSEITHLVARSDNTEKVHEAMLPPYHGKISVVLPSWFYDSMALFTRVPEKDHLLRPEASTTPKTPSASLPPSDLGEPEIENGQVEEELEPAGEIDTADVDWGDADEELEAFLNESDDEDGAASDTGSVVSSNSKRKRPRPSSLSGSRTADSEPPSPDASPRKSSALSKRARFSSPSEDGPPVLSADDSASAPAAKAQGEEEEENNSGSDEEDMDEVAMWAKELEGSFANG